MIRWAHGRGMDITFIEVMPLGEIERAARRPVPAAVSQVRAGLAEHFTLDESDYRTGGPARYVTRARDRRAASASSRR